MGFPPIFFFFKHIHPPTSELFCAPTFLRGNHIFLTSFRFYLQLTDRGCLRIALCVGWNARRALPHGLPRRHGPGRDPGEPDSRWRLGGALWPAESACPPRDLGELSQPMRLCLGKILRKKGCWLNTLWLVWITFVWGFQIEWSVWRIHFIRQLKTQQGFWHSG